MHYVEFRSWLYVELYWRITPLLSFIVRSVNKVSSSWAMSNIGRNASIVYTLEGLSRNSKQHTILIRKLYWLGNVEYLSSTKMILSWKTVVYIWSMMILQPIMNHWQFSITMSKLGVELKHSTSFRTQSSFARWRMSSQRSWVSVLESKKNIKRKRSKLSMMDSVILTQRGHEEGHFRLLKLIKACIKQMD